VFLRTLLLSITQALANALLECYTSRPAGALLTTPTIELWSANSAPIGQAMVYSQFTPATFSGYAMQAITLSAPVTLDPRTQGLIGNVSFIATTASPFVPDTILGYMLTSGSGVLYGAEQFASPVPIAGAGNFLNLEFALPQPSWLGV